MAKKKLTERMLIDWWLKKYHNTTLEEVRKLHPEWGENDWRDFYFAYPVTQEQYDEWKTWAFNEMRKHFRWSKKATERIFCWVDFNTAPPVKD